MKKPTRMTHGKSSAGCFLLFVSLAYKFPGQVLECFPSVRGGCMEKQTTKKESSTNGKLVLWGLVIWIPDIP